MQIKNIQETEYFTAADGCRITETFGIPTSKPAFTLEGTTMKDGSAPKESVKRDFR